MERDVSPELEDASSAGPHVFVRGSGPVVDGDANRLGACSIMHPERAVGASIRCVYAFLFLTIQLTGCAAIQDFRYETTNSLRTEWAWRQTGGASPTGVCAADYGRGWKAGYFSVMTGGNGQPPSLPPSQYWSASYQTEMGQQLIAAWYRGHIDGVEAARANGAGTYHYLRPAVRHEWAPDEDSEEMPGSCPVNAEESRHTAVRDKRASLVSSGLSSPNLARLPAVEIGGNGLDVGDFAVAPTIRRFENAQR